jgi:hydrogenase/urease accessory protein HupE
MIEGSAQVRAGRDTGLLRSVFSFPNPVNEVAARLVAAMVVGLSLATIVTGQQWLFFLLAYGFLARVATGPTLSPIGLVATRALVPLLGNPSRPVPGPPKRFAQTVGLVFSATALGLSLAMESTVPARAVVGVLAVFATLESAAGFCAGCFVFNHLMRWGLIPESVCRECVIAEAPA